MRIRLTPLEKQFLKNAATTPREDARTAGVLLFAAYEAQFSTVEHARFAMRLLSPTDANLGLRFLVYGMLVDVDETFWEAVAVGSYQHRLLAASTKNRASIRFATAVDHTLAEVVLNFRGKPAVHGLGLRGLTDIEIISAHVAALHQFLDVYSFYDGEPLEHIAATLRDALDAEVVSAERI